MTTRFVSRFCLTCLAIGLILGSRGTSQAQDCYPSKATPQAVYPAPQAVPQMAPVIRSIPLATPIPLAVPQSSMPCPQASGQASPQASPQCGGSACACYWPQGNCPFPSGNCPMPSGNCVAQVCPTTFQPAAWPQGSPQFSEDVAPPYTTTMPSVPGK